MLCEDGNLTQISKLTEVLILVLMEDALRVFHGIRRNEVLHVLILVLMEDALRDKSKVQVIDKYGSLNPCSNGRCSARDVS